MAAIEKQEVSRVEILPQHPVFHDADGRETFFIVDFYCHERRLAIEVDGEVHDCQTTEDADRTERIECLGARLIRFRNSEVAGDVDDVLRRIAEYLGV